MIVFFDIDGTIVDDGTQIIPESTVRAVEKLGQNGHIAVVNTGRPYSHIDPRVRAMAFRGWVCGCGMEIRLDDSWLVRSHPDAALQRRAVEAVRRHHMKPLYEAADGAILLTPESMGNRWIREEAERVENKHFPIRHVSSDEVPEFMKFVAFNEADSDPAGFIRELEPWFTIIDRGETMLELVMKGCSKAQGMQQVLDHLGADRDNTLAIGDSHNDLPMFALAGHTVCMGNGKEICKQQAEYITDTVLNDGIEKALRHYQLID